MREEGDKTVSCYFARHFRTEETQARGRKRDGIMLLKYRGVRVLPIHYNIIAADRFYNFSVFPNNY